VTLEAETSSFLNLKSAHLTTFLADTKDKAGTAGTVMSQGPPKRQPVVTLDDNDFTISFD
jgi:hypothetical protein